MHFSRALARPQRRHAVLLVAGKVDACMPISPAIQQRLHNVRTLARMRMQRASPLSRSLGSAPFLISSATISGLPSSTHAE